MTDLDFERELKKERLKGRYSVLVAIIGAVALMIAAIIGLYQPLQEQNTELIEENTESQNEISELRDRISQSEETISNLQGMLADLRTTQGKSENENSTLQGQLSALQDENARLMQELDELKAATPSEVDSALQQQISALEDENSRLKREIETLRGGSALPSGTSYDLLTVCPPYETKGYERPEKLAIMGVKYQNSFYLSCSDDENAYAYFNLNEQYNTLEFDIGHIDGSDMRSRNLTIYLNGEAEEPIELKSNMMLTHYSIPVSGIRQVRMVIYTDNWEGYSNYYPQYGFINAMLYS